MRHPLTPLLAHLKARLAPAVAAVADAARDEECRALAAFLADPGGRSSPPPPAARGFARTPGIGAAIAGQRETFAASAAEAAAQALEAEGRDAEAAARRTEARRHHAAAAALFCRAVGEIPDVDDDESETTRQHRLAKALALMLLARAAIQAGEPGKRWDRFGNAEELAARAVAMQPLLPYLRFQRAELLRLQGRRREAIAAIEEARPLATGTGERMRLADEAAETAAGSGDAALMAEVEARFIAPLLAPGREDGPEDPAPDDVEAATWASVLAFRAGKLDLARAAAVAVQSTEQLALSRRAARRFARSIALIPAGREGDRAALIGWLKDAQEAAARAALAAGAAAASADILARSPFRDAPDPERVAAADALRAALDAGRQAAFAATALLAPDPASFATRLALAGLAGRAAGRIEAGTVAVPAPPEPIVVELVDPLLIEEPLAQRIIGGEGVPSIARLRAALRDRHAVTLPGVRLRGLADEGEGRRIAVRLRGREAIAITAPQGAELAIVHPREAARAGLAVLAGPAVTIGGLACAWVAEGGWTRGILVLPPAFALLAPLEAAVMRALPSLVGLNEAARAFPGLGEERLDGALAVLRALLAERMPLGLAGVLAVVGERIAAGDGPEEVMAQLRALPGVTAALWGNEPGRQAVALPAALEQALAQPDAPLAAARAIDDLLRGSENPVLVAASATRRARVRRAIARWHPDLPVLAACERASPP